MLSMRKQAVLLVIVTCCFSFLNEARSLQAEDWPQFRGPNCSGVSSAKNALPAEFNDQKNVLWSAKLGDGIGCPVVAAGRVFTSGMVGKDKIALYAFDAKNRREAVGACLEDRRSIGDSQNKQLRRDDTRRRRRTGLLLLQHAGYAGR